MRSNQSKSQGVWLVLANKGTTHPTTLSYDEALDEAICFGWIDGQLGRRDSATVRRRFTPRNARSPWSQRNVAIAERAERLRPNASIRGRRGSPGKIRWSMEFCLRRTSQHGSSRGPGERLGSQSPCSGNVSEAHKCKPLLHPLSDRKRNEDRDPSQAHRTVCGNARPRRDRPPARFTIS